METFNFCPNSQVPETMPRDPTQGTSMNGWDFAAKPTTPYQRKFKLTLHGLRWFLNDKSGFYDETTQPTINARALEKFYERNETWNPFLWNHPHLGPLTVRFAAAVSVPAGEENSGGFIKALEITLIHHNPGY